MNNYEINLETLAIIPLNATETRIIEKNDDFIVNSSSMKIIDDCCRFFGSTYAGRMEGTKSMIGVNYKAPIIYRIIMDTYFYFVPIQPDLGDYLISILTLFLPFLILLYLSRIVDKYKRIKNQDYSVKMFKVSDFAVAALLIVFGCVVLGIGPYKLVGIETGSMTPSLRIGDAVIIDKNCDRDKLKVDDIIAYVNHDNVLVVHRIIQVNSDGTFVTKGDYNNAADSGFVNKSQVKGKVSFKIPFIAYPAIKFKQK